MVDNMKGDMQTQHTNFANNLFPCYLLLVAEKEIVDSICRRRKLYSEAKIKAYRILKRELRVL